MAHMTYEESKRAVFRGLGLLALITLIEVIFSLAGKGHIPGLGFLKGLTWASYVIGFILIALSLYKARFIIYDFMHLKHEVSGLAATILLPMFLLVWAIIAFFQEGNFWGERRAMVQRANALPSTEMPAVSPAEQGRTIEFEPAPADEAPLSGETSLGEYDVDN